MRRVQPPRFALAEQRKPGGHFRERYTPLVIGLSTKKENS